MVKTYFSAALLHTIEQRFFKEIWKFWVFCQETEMKYKVSILNFECSALKLRRTLPFTSDYCNNTVMMCFYFSFMSPVYTVISL